MFLRGKGVVMFFNDPLNVFGAAIAYFDGISVEEFVEFVRSWEVFVDKRYKGFCDVGSDVLTEWWVEPDDVSFSRSFLLSWGCWFVL